MILRKKMPMEKEKRKKNPKKSAHALQKKRWAGRGARARKDRHNTGIVLHFNEGPPCLDNISIESAPFFFLWVQRSTLLRWREWKPDHAVCIAVEGVKWNVFKLFCRVVVLGVGWFGVGVGFCQGGPTSWVSFRVFVVVEIYLIRGSWCPFIDRF